jgi:glycine betaine/proline transport system substrate-binding protein
MGGGDRLGPSLDVCTLEIRFLKNPENVFESAEETRTITSTGLKEKVPAVYRFLGNYQISPEPLGQLMIWIQEGHRMIPYDKALRHMRYHGKQIQSWLE